jgi:hypothetical protein
VLGNAFGPLALVLVGVTLARRPRGRAAEGALVISLIKNLLHPALMVAGWLVAGLRGMPLAVMIGGRLAAGGGQRVFVLAALPRGRRPGDSQRGGIHRAGAAQRVAGDGAVAESCPVDHGASRSRTQASFSSR